MHYSSPHPKFEWSRCHSYHRLLLITILALTVISSTSQAASTTYGQKTITSRRDKNLDHWDASTLAYYLHLDPVTAEPLPPPVSNSTTNSRYFYPGIDTSIMFYAQWCQNCHKFAPIWDLIATLLNAGTTQSNLILSLFDCELNPTHMKLCDAAGVTHYPTLLHVGAGPYPQTDPISTFLFGGKGGKDKAVGPFGWAKLDRTVKFQGDFSVGDSVLDWIRTMRGVSRWHQLNYGEGGWLTRIRRFLSVDNLWKKRGKSGKKGDYADLPVGVPTVAIGSAGAGTGDALASTLQKELDDKEVMLTKVKEKVEDLNTATTYAGLLIESFLFPQPLVDEAGESNNTRTVSDVGDDVTGEHADPFITMLETNAWNMTLKSQSNTSITAPPPSPHDTEAYILQSCVIDLTLDYCTRLSTKLTNDYLNVLEKGSSSGNVTEYPTLTEMEGQLLSIIKNTEPYCAILNECYVEGFTGDGCRPSACPFGNAGACRYVATCLSPKVAEEYGNVVKNSLKDGSTIYVEGVKDVDGDGDTDSTNKEGDENVKVGAGGGKFGGWGMKK